MKKMTAAAVFFALIALLAACGGQHQPDGTVSASSSSATDEETLYPAFGAYVTYIDSKNAAIEDIISYLTTGEDPNNSITDMLSVILEPELAMTPLKVFGSSGYDNEKNEVLNITDVAVTQEKNTYGITYNRDGSAWELNCVYDEQAGSLQVSAVCGEEKYFFEMTKAGSGYASQYYLKDDAVLVKIFFDGETVAYGAEVGQDKPASILDGRTLSADFTKNDEMYLILKEGKLSAFVNGEQREYSEPNYS